MKTAIIKTNKGYHPVLENGLRYYSLDGKNCHMHTIAGAQKVSKPSPSLEAAKRRITRAGLTWEPESPLTLTVTEAAKLAGVTRPTIISWVQRGRLIPLTYPPDNVTFSRRSVERAMRERKDFTAGRPKKPRP